ncbi:MAG: helix-turn-helix transcriptional regulator [Chitinophagales bacterium]|nr:helix-turn-helix transcriptional regulator [Chitinophagales bacterium]
MKANRTGFLGDTLKSFQNDLMRVSVVEYTHKVSEEWHYHEDVHLSSILVGGNRESRKKGDIDVVPGKLMTYREGEIHRNRNTVFPSKNLNIELSTSFFNDEFQFSNLKLSSGAYLSMLKIYYELFINDTYSNDSIQQTITSIFFKDKSGRMPDWIETLKSLLNDRWQEFVPLHEISNELGFHPVTISKSFAKHTQCTLADYMRIIKIKRAVNLIFNSSHSLTEITYICGFSDQSHMNRLFKYYIGTNPRKLKKVNI